MRYEKLSDKISKEIPNVRILNKSQNKLMKLIGLLSNDFDKFTTTIFNAIYVPNDFESWDDNHKYIMLRHELMHLRQFRKWPLEFLNKSYLWWINAIMMGFCYLFILPIKYTLRTKFEKEGYTQTLLANYELGLLDNAQKFDALIDNIAQNFDDKLYLYMWNYNDAKEWLDGLAKNIKNGSFKNDIDRIG